MSTPTSVITKSCLSRSRSAPATFFLESDSINHFSVSGKPLTSDVPVSTVDESTCPSEASGISLNFLANSGRDELGIGHLPSCSPLNRVTDSVWRQDTLFVFDWDDTLFPSSWIRKFASSPWNIDTCMSLDARILLDSVAESAENVIRRATALGRVVVISNAHSRWLQHSLRRYSPKLNTAFQQLRVPLLSARDVKGLSSPLAWKFACMAQEIAGTLPCMQLLSAVDLHAETLTKCDSLSRHGSLRTALDANEEHPHDISSIPLNVISFGDQPHDRLAFFLAAHLRTKVVRPKGIKCTAKSIKFIESPDILDLKRQLDLVFKEIGGLVSSSCDLDLRFSADSNPSGRFYEPINPLISVKSAQPMRT